MVSVTVAQGMAAMEPLNDTEAFDIIRYEARFQTWRARVKRDLQASTSIGIDDLCDALLRDWFDAKMTPAFAASTAIRNELVEIDALDKDEDEDEDEDY